MGADDNRGSAARVGPLDDIRVLDLTRFLAGPFATTLLADLGADVVRIIRPDETPKPGPLTVPVAFEWATNRDKRSVVLELAGEPGHATFLDLVAKADVVVSNFRPGILERLRIDHGSLAMVNPRIVTLDISGFGDEGDWAQMPSYDLIAQAASGSIDITGPHDDTGSPPVRWGVPVGDIAAALYGTIGLLAALAVRDRDGVGQRVSVSMLDALLSIATYRVPQVFDAGLSARADQHMGGGGTRPYGPFRCADGRWVAIGFAQPHWANACRTMDAPELVEDPRFRDEHARNRNFRELEEVIAGILRGRPAQEWETAFIEAGAPAGRVNTLKEAFAHPQTAARGLIETIGDAAGRVAHVAGDPMSIGRPQHPPVVLDGVDELGWDVRDLSARVVPAAGDDPAGDARPFAGTRVVEMDGNEPSKTLAAQILADLGADVLLIERPEPVRPRDPLAPPDAFTLTDAMRWGMHRGKRAITLDLKSEEDRARYYDIVRGADIIYDNYRPGVKARLGVARDQLVAANPTVVTCSATGFGATGPWAQAPAYDVTLQALSGSMSITGNGRPDDPPIRWGHPIGGLAGGLYGTIAVLASLRDVRRGRPARHTDLSLFDVQIAMHTYRVPQAIDLDIDFGPQPRSGGSGARPYGIYPTGDGRWFAAGITDQFWEPFCDAMGLEALARDPSFATGEARTTNAEALESLVEDAFRARSASEIESIFLAHRLPGSRVLTLEEAFQHPAALLHGMLKVVESPGRRPVHVAGSPIRLSASPVGQWTPPPGWV